MMDTKNKPLNFSRYVPSDTVLNKKVPENPKYKNIKAAVYTGRNVNRQLGELKEKCKNAARQNEVYKRIKFSSFIKLAVTIAKDQKHGIDEQTFLGDDQCDIDEIDCDINNKSSIANVLVGIGELDLINKKKTVTPQKEDCTLYLLLDVRDREEYLKFHIKTARHYPAALLSRSIGYETEDMKLFKNIPYHMIILYDNDETVASRAASTLVQRGYSNVFIISGGIKSIQKTFPSIFLDAVFAEISSQSIREVTSAIRISRPLTELYTENDINTIQQYIDVFSIKDGNQIPTASSASLPKSTTKHNQQDKLLGSSTYRKNSVCSEQGSNVNHLDNLVHISEMQMKSGRKTPWR